MKILPGVFITKMTVLDLLQLVSIMVINKLSRPSIKVQFVVLCSRLIKVEWVSWLDLLAFDLLGDRPLLLRRVLAVSGWLLKCCIYSRVKISADSSDRFFVPVRYQISTLVLNSSAAPIFEDIPRLHLRLEHICCSSAIAVTIPVIRLDHRLSSELKCFSLTVNKSPDDPLALILSTLILKDARLSLDLRFLVIKKCTSLLLFPLIVGLLTVSCLTLDRVPAGYHLDDLDARLSWCRLKLAHSSWLIILISRFFLTYYVSINNLNTLIPKLISLHPCVDDRALPLPEICIAYIILRVWVCT